MYFLYNMLSSIQKRFLMFLIGCIGVRSLFAYVAKHSSKQSLFYLGMLALIPAIGFIIIYFSGIRTSGPEVFGEKIWWNELRIVHALLYILFAIYAFQNKSFAWIPLAIDVIVGLIAFLFYHNKVGSFESLF